MVGITSYGAYIPWYRLDRKNIRTAVGFMGASALKGEKAVANWDEDSISMAVAAGVDCLTGFDRNNIGGLYFATTTPPYSIRQNSSIISTTLDLSPKVRTADFTGALKAGTSALLPAFETVKSEGSNNVLVCAADCRLSTPGGNLEHIYGDGAAAILVGNEDVIATLEGSYSTSYDFTGVWRTANQKFEHLWEDRFIREIGYARIITEAITEFIEKYKIDVKQLSKIVYTLPYTREHAGIAKKLGAEPEQIQDILLNDMGDTGTAYSLMLLIAALEDSKPGDRILVASYGNGSDVLLFQVTENITKMKGKRGIKKHLASKMELTSYEKYLAFRGILPVEIGKRGEEITDTQLSLLYRDRRTILGLVGTKCKKCGTPQYPNQIVCVNPNCKAVNQMEPHRFSDKKGSLFSYTGDNLAFSISPPATYGIVDFDGGGRFWFDIADCSLEGLTVGMPVEMTFRRSYADEDRGVYSYFWKAMPQRVQ